MSFLSRWFGSNPTAGGRSQPAAEDLEAQLAALTDTARNAAQGFQGSPLNRAGDLCLQAGEHRRALEYYGRAIDTFLRDGQRDAARGVANKIIRAHPAAVRTLCTLTWLDLAVGHTGTAREHLGQYWRAAKDGDRSGLARNEILAMARLVSQMEFLSAAADALDQLDFAEDAARVRRWAADGGSPDSVHDPHELSERCMERAVGSDASRRAEGDVAMEDD